MALTVSDGGGGTAKPTTTTTGNGKPDTTKPVNPLLSLTKPRASTPSKPSGSGGGSGTAFNRKPALNLTAPGLRDAVRTSKGSASTPSKSSASKPSPSKPDASAPVKSSTSTPRGENDGRAEVLNDDNHVGSRDSRITALRAEQQRLEREERTIEGQIDDLEDEIERDSAISGGVRTGVDIVTAPVGFVAGLFGKKNPVAEGAAALTDTITGLEGDKKNLEEQEDRLETQQQAIEDEIKKLETEQVMNFLADTAHVVDMDDEVADFLENGRSKVGDLDVRLRVADGTGSGSDGVFDAADNSITVDEALINETRTKMEQLQRQGIVDGDGNIVDAERFDAASAGDDVIKTVSTISVHEYNHATQHAENRFAAAFAAKEQIATDLLTGFLGEGNKVDETISEVVQSALVAGETERSRQVEVESYRLQEQNDLRSGATKKAFITIDESGNPLPEDQQLANVMAYQAARPLPYGPTAGYERAGSALEVAGIVGDEDDHGHSHDDGHDHGALVADGSTSSGIRGPGLDADGIRGPGIRGPGLDADGIRGPGLVASALAGDGIRGPGETADGIRGPGLLADALAAAGIRGPGTTADGFAADGIRGPGLDADGIRGPGIRGPGISADGIRGPGLLADALIAAGLFGDGIRGPGYDADGIRGPGLDADGIRGPGIRGPGVNVD